MSALRLAHSRSERRLINKIVRMETIHVHLLISQRPLEIASLVMHSEAAVIFIRSAERKELFP